MVGWDGERRRLLEERARAEYGERFDGLQRPSREEAARAAGEREALLEQLAGRALTGCSGTKLDCSSLSPGCACCGRGTWSCLFVTGRCNCRCFYCPTGQDENIVPGTNSLTFPEPGGYLDYLEVFGFEGVGLSGGEPLLEPETTLSYLRAVKGRFGNRVHAWLYTNGTLLDRGLLGRLADAGLDEIRFDLSAVGYDLGKAALARGAIRTVTVEIPAVPEDLDRLRDLLPEMRRCGVDHLNLHQLRLTPHNVERLAGRGYRFLVDERVTVLDSELAALRLLAHVLDTGLDLPVNYCSFVYKHRYQRAAVRRRSAAPMAAPFEAITGSGYLRRLTLTGEPEALTAQERLFLEAGRDGSLWSRTGDRTLHFDAGLWPLVEFHRAALAVSYFETRFVPAISYHHRFREFLLDGGRSVFVERVPVSGAVELGATDPPLFAAHFLAPAVPEPLPAGDPWDRIADLERIRPGLQEYSPGP